VTRLALGVAKLARGEANLARGVTNLARGDVLRASCRTWIERRLGVIAFSPVISRIFSDARSGRRRNRSIQLNPHNFTFRSSAVCWTIRCESGVKINERLISKASKLLRLAAREGFTRGNEVYRGFSTQ